MAFELNDVASWLYGKLANDTLIQGIVGKHPVKSVWQVYENMALQGAIAPYVIFAYKTSRTARGGGGRRVFVMFEYDVFFVHEGESAGQTVVMRAGQQVTLNIAAGAAHLDQILYKSESLLQPPILGCSSLKPIQRVLFEADIRRNLTGMTYQVFVDSEATEPAYP